jgi:hypothetical protein
MLAQNMFHKNYDILHIFEEFNQNKKYLKDKKEHIIFLINLISDLNKIQFYIWCNL